MCPTKNACEENWKKTCFSTGEKKHLENNHEKLTDQIQLCSPELRSMNLLTGHDEGRKCLLCGAEKKTG